MLSTVNKPYLMQNNKCKICYEILSIRYYGKKFLPLQPKMVVWLRLCVNTLDNNNINIKLKIKNNAYNSAIGKKRQKGACR